MIRLRRAMFALMNWIRFQIVDLYLTDRRLHRRLRKITQREEIAILPMLPIHRGSCYVAGRYFKDLRQIQIVEKHRFDPWILAHEIGHHVALKRGNGTEEAADHEGYQVLRSVLSEIETRAVAWRMDILLPRDPSHEAQGIVNRADKIRRLAWHSKANRNEKAVALARLAEMQVVEDRARRALAQVRTHRRNVKIDQKYYARTKYDARSFGLLLLGMGSVNLLSGAFVAARIFFALVPITILFFVKAMHYRYVTREVQKYGSRICFGVGDGCIGDDRG